MAGQYVNRMTFLIETVVQSPSGFPTVTVTDGDVMGAAMRTTQSRPVEGNNGEITNDGTQVIATVRRSIRTNLIEEGQHVRVDGDTYRIVGISKKMFDRRELDLFLEKVSEVSA